MLYWHSPVMVREVMEILKPGTGQRYLDGTLGAGGHTEHLLELSAPSGQVLGLDWDDKALASADARLTRFGNRLVTRRANFTEAHAVLTELGWNKVDGALLDLGFSSQQIQDAERGLSFNVDQRLDMRMDSRQPLSAHQVVNSFSVRQLQQIFHRYGEEPQARKVAFAIDHERRQSPIETTRQLAALIERTVQPSRQRIHPATRAFQALRIFVNQELRNLEVFLEDGYNLLSPKGRMAIISFHSLEDRLVKQAFARWSKDCLCPPRIVVCQCGWTRKTNLLTRKPIMPSAKERQENRRSRSAKLRAVERL
jgi:16S rRNA (cytosine1402-N4)-methyltransferase